MLKPLIVISGPTSCGKTDVSIELAKKINGEIISADSMQVYKFMNIGTAKIKKSQMQGINHYLIDEFYPDSEFSVAVFKKYAKKYAKEIFNKNKIPIITGGTGFYINSLLFDNDFEETKKDEKYRKNLQEIALTKGNIYLHAMLKEIDFESYQKIHPNNVKKVIRALEFYNIKGEKISEHNKQQKNKKPVYNHKMFILNMERTKLYENINKRVDKMVKEGLIEEVESLLKKGYTSDLVAMQGIAYKEMIQYIKGNASLDYTIELIKKNTRNFAKRQITWFKHQCDGNWINVENKDKNEIATDIINLL